MSSDTAFQDRFDQHNTPHTLLMAHEGKYYCIMRAPNRKPLVVYRNRVLKTYPMKGDLLHIVPDAVLDTQYPGWLPGPPPCL